MQEAARVLNDVRQDLKINIDGYNEPPNVMDILWEKAWSKATGKKKTEAKGQGAQIPNLLSPGDTDIPSLKADRRQSKTTQPTARKHGLPRYTSMAQSLATQHGGHPNLKPLDATSLCLLSLDGGEVRGMSTLCILECLMARLNRQRQSDGLPRVKLCEVFDLIGGTSTAG
jgi:hypothetical protein